MHFKHLEKAARLHRNWEMLCLKRDSLNKITGITVGMTGSAAPRLMDSKEVDVVTETLGRHYEDEIQKVISELETIGVTFED